MSSPNGEPRRGPTGNPPAVDGQAAVFHLGGTYDVLGVYLWNHHQAGLTGRGVDQFGIPVSGDAKPLTASCTNLRTFTLDEAYGCSTEGAQFVPFTVTGMRLVKLDFDTVHGAETDDCVGLSEVRFEIVSRASAFGDPSCASQTGTSWTDVTATSDGVTLAETIGGPSEGARYRWRARGSGFRFDVGMLRRSASRGMRPDGARSSKSPTAVPTAEGAGRRWFGAAVPTGRRRRGRLTFFRSIWYL